MLTKVTKHSKNKLQAKKQTWVQFVFAVPWIIRNKPLRPIVGCLPLSYTFLSYCNGLLKILGTNLLCPLHVRELKSFSSKPPWPPDQGLCSWTPLGALPPDPHCRLALYALAMCPPRTAHAPLFQYSGASAAVTGYKLTGRLLRHQLSIVVWTWHIAMACNIDIDIESNKFILHCVKKTRHFCFLV